MHVSATGQPVVEFPPGHVAWPDAHTVGQNAGQFPAACKIQN